MIDEEGRYWKPLNRAAIVEGIADTLFTRDAEADSWPKMAELIAAYLESEGIKLLRDDDLPARWENPQTYDNPDDLPAEFAKPKPAQTMSDAARRAVEQWYEAQASQRGTTTLRLPPSPLSTTNSNPDSATAEVAVEIRYTDGTTSRFSGGEVIMHIDEASAEIFRENLRQQAPFYFPPPSQTRLT